MIDRIQVYIPGTPVPFARTGGGKGAPRFTPGKQRKAMADIRLLAIQAMGDRGPIEGPVRLTIRCTYRVPDSWPRKRRAAASWKTSKPDGDNLQKLVKDSFNGVVWVDDAQVADWAGSKRYGDRDETLVIVEPLGGLDGQAEG